MSETFIAPMRFETDEYVIRAYQLGDGVAMGESVRSSYEHLRPWMPWASQTQSAEESEALCRSMLAKYLQNEDYTLGIWKGDKLLGGTGFHLRQGPRESRNAEIGMWIHQEAAGTGMGAAVLRAMLEWGFTEWSWERLVWRCDTKNIASSRVAEKCGLTLEGTFRKDARGVDGNLRDTHVYAILANEWRNSEN